MGEFIRCEKHLAFIRTLPCLATAMGGVNIEAHHLTVGRFMMGKKLGDDQTVPLASHMHTGGPCALHSMGEAKFWNARGIDPRPLAIFFWLNTGDFDACVDAIREAHLKSNGIRWDGVKIFEEK